MSGLPFDSIIAAQKALSSGQISARELAEQALAAIRSPQAAALNAVVAMNEQATLAQADAADTLRSSGQAGPLTGIPLAHKDIFVTQQWPTTAGSRMLAGYMSPFDATVVARLSAAGMVTLGKLNCDEFAMGSANQHSAFGPARNPWDLTAVPGGSSGGSAAAVAAGLVLAATATDTGGSIRQPAALCGVSGIKPTYGVVSRYGMIAYASSLDQGGPIARTAEDCALVLDAMSGFDERDSTSVADCGGELNAPGRIWRAFQADRAQRGSQTRPLDGLRIGVPAEFFGAGLSAEVGDAVEEALRQLEKLGATRVALSLPLTEMSIPAYYVIAPAEASSNLSRYDGVRYGHRTREYDDLASMVSRSRAEGFGAEVQRRILAGTYVLSHGYYDAYYLQAQRVRRLIAQDFRRAFEQCDVIAGPVSPTVAWNLGEKASDPVAEYLADIYTLGTNLAGLPGMSIPCGFGRDAHARRPVGLQLTGRWFDEARLLGVAHQFQQATDWHLRRP
jgi:aspartyl-tRNA(Asn)/glutamyl-tRNA(Gln) amidotransferase subunit A